MSTFKLGKISLQISQNNLTRKLVRILRSGHYERQEASALALCLTAQDRLLEIGTGAGYLAIMAAKIVGAERVVSVEANPALLEDIRHNLNRNNVEKVTLLHHAVVADPAPPEINLFVADAFWSASVHETAEPDAKPVSVPAIGFDTLLARYPAEVLLCDVEGAEKGYFLTTLPDALHTIIIELHPKICSPSEIKAIFDRLSKLGFGYWAKGSIKQVVCFKRVE